MKISQFAHIACPAAAFAALLLTATLPAAAQSGAQTSAQTSGQPAAPAAQSPVVASAVGAITLPVTAVNDKGDPVKGLTAADLKLTDNGSAQTIQSISPAVTTPVDFGIIGQTSSGLKFELGDMRLAGVRFVDHTLPGTQNQYLVIQYANEVDLLADPTKAQDTLHDAINKLGSPQFGSENNGGDSSDQGSSQHHSSGGTLNDAIYLAATEELKKLPGQHILILVSDGVDHDSKESMTDAIEAAQNAHTAIFAIYYKSEEEVQRNPNQNNRHGGQMPGSTYPDGGYPGGGGGYPGGGGGQRRGGQNPSEQPHEDGKANLEHICTATGGYMVEGKRDKADEAFNKIVDLLKNQYTLTFVPTKEAADSDFQRLSLTTEKKGVYPLIQQGYSAQQ
jgi:VWFA-related protein